MENTLDPQVVNLAKAIRQSESGGNFNTPKGKAGEVGAYQFTPATWKAQASRYGINVPIEQATPEQQNAVAYNKIKEWKDNGKDVTQIASMWNAGEGEPNAYTGKFSNGQPSVKKNPDGTIKFDVPSYVKSVATAYQTLKNGGQAQADPSNPSSTANPENAPEKTLGQELSGRLGQAGSALSDAATGKISPFSGVIQAVGAGAGALGDVVNKGLEIIPGVKKAETWIGQKLGDLANTSLGQSVMGEVQKFKEAHPELADDIGAGFNIVTAIPILRGIGTIADVGLRGVAGSLANTARKGALNDIFEGVSSAGKSGKDLLAKDGGDKLSEALTNKMLSGELIDSSSGVPKWNTKEAIQTISDENIAPLDEKLQNILNTVSQKQSIGQDLKTLEKRAIQEAENDPLLREAGIVPQAVKRIQTRFEGWRYSFGDTVDLAQENRLKIGSGKFSDWGTPEHSADKAIYRALQTDIEDIAGKLGLGDVKALNAKMGRFIQAQKMLEILHDRKIKLPRVGLIKRGVRLGAKAIGGVVGEGIGNATGFPIIGTLGGGAAGSFLERGGEKATSGLLRNAILRRTGETATKISLKKTATRAGGLVGGTVLQKSNK